MKQLSTILIAFSVILLLIALFLVFVTPSFAAKCLLFGGLTFLIWGFIAIGEVADDKRKQWDNYFKK